MKYFILQQWIASCQDGELGESADTILITPNTKDVVWESAVLFKSFQDVELIVRTSLTFKVKGACYNMLLKYRQVNAHLKIF